MHPHLHTKDNAGCKELMEALEECHAQGFIHKVLGNCNEVKTDLTKCLRAERLERQRENREKAQAKRALVQQAWKEIDDDYE